MTATIDDTVTQPGDGPAPRRRRPWVLAFFAVGTALILSVWVYAFTLAPDKGVYRLDDPNWVDSARAVCADARQQLEALTDTGGGVIQTPTLEQMQQRAALVDQATDIVEEMLNDLMAIPVTSDRDRDILGVFEKYYRIVISDRRHYADELRAGNNVRYSESVVEDAGGPVTNVITDFTAGVKGNDVPACSPPNDLVNVKPM
ncbi:MAG: hypothetical protein R2694_06840 [Ilumatobacteraceae bacterium]|nr:hypothetical protein [Ilumatobacter sp.]